MYPSTVNVTLRPLNKQNTIMISFMPIKAKNLPEDANALKK